MEHQSNTRTSENIFISLDVPLNDRKTQNSYSNKNHNFSSPIIIINDKQLNSKIIVKFCIFTNNEMVTAYRIKD